MAYDEALADRVREVIGARPAVIEKKMFGGLAFMVAGNMACGVMGEDLIVRIDKDEGDAVLAEPHVRPFDFTGKPMRGFVVIGAEAIAEPEGLAQWVDRGADHAASLPPK